MDGRRFSCLEELSPTVSRVIRLFNEVEIVTRPKRLETILSDYK